MARHFKCVCLAIVSYNLLIHALGPIDKTTSQPDSSTLISSQKEPPRNNIRVLEKRSTTETVNNTQDNESDDIQNKINIALDFFMDGESKIVYSKKNEAIVVLGISGSGKSTLLQFLLTDNTKLNAIEINGEIIIEDGNKKIGSSSKSHTKIPELYITSDDYYDCPGFEDTNDENHDIASSYFIKSVFDNIKEVKLIFLIDHFSVRYGNDRIGFRKLTDHIIDLLPNIEKFKDSIALIVTKVEKKMKSYDRKTGRAIFKSDSETIDDIANVLESFKSDFNNAETIKLKGKEKVEKMITLIDIFINKNSKKEFNKIGIFERPMIEGPLSEDEVLQETKISLLNLIQTHLKFTPKNPQDIRYSLADASKLYITKFNTIIINSAQKKLIDIKNQFYDSFILKCNGLNDLDDKQELTSNAIDKISEFATFIEKNNFFNDNSIIKLRDIIKSIDENVPIDEDVTYILKLIKFFNFIKTFESENTSSNSFIFKTEISNMKRFLESFKNWFIFTQEINSYLTQYDIQNAKHLYNVKNVSNWGLPNAVQGIQITKENIGIFLSKLPQKFSYVLQTYEYLQQIDIKLIDTLIRDLNKILSNTLKSTLKTEYKNSEVILSGKYIKLKDVLQVTKKYDATYFTVLASNIIYLDTDLSLYESKHLSIISPKWVTIKPVKITLNGKSGKNQQVSQANSGAYAGYSGNDGLHGSSGYPSGNFIGVGDEIEKSRFLTVLTQGGTGAPGQNGGNGAKGISGDYPSNKDQLHDSCECAYCRCTSEFWGNLECDSNWYRDDKVILIFVNIINYSYHCRLYGTKGSNGGNGGNGGKGGLGGIAGHITLKFNKNQYINTKQVEGTTGTHGSGGSGGETGSRQIALFKKVKKVNYPSYIFRYCYYHEENTYDYYNNGKDGLKGNQIYTNQHRINPESINMINILGKYISYTSVNEAGNIETMKFIKTFKY